MKTHAQQVYEDALYAMHMGDEHEAIELMTYAMLLAEKGPPTPQASAAIVSPRKEPRRKKQRDPQLAFELDQLKLDGVPR